eukprot:6410652-Lingulodinium_polyedra.AAC.1
MLVRSMRNGPRPPRRVGPNQARPGAADRRPPNQWSRKRNRPCRYTCDRARMYEFGRHNRPST